MMWEEQYDRATGSYNTRDICRSIDGALMFVSRSDDQVKVRGIRMNLSYVAQRLELLFQMQARVLESQPGVLVALLPAIDLSQVDPIEDSLAKLRSIALSELPAAMVPSYFLPQAKDHLTLSGKWNKKELLEQIQQIYCSNSNFGTIESNLYDQLRHTLQLVLGHATPSSDMAKSFTHLGGNSLQAIEFIWHVYERWKVRLKPQDVLGHTKLEEFVPMIEQGINAPRTRRCPIDQPEIKKQRGFLIEQNWSRDCVKCIDGTPLVIETTQPPRVIVGSHAGRLYCFEIKTGDILWNTKVKERVEASCVYSPTNQVALTGCYAGYLYALNIFSGDITWQLELDGTIKSTPVLDVTRNLCWCGTYGHTIYGVDLVAGQAKFKIPVDGSVFASPVLHGTGFYAATTWGMIHSMSIRDDGLVATLWKRKMQSAVFSTPLLLRDRLIFGCTDGNVYAIKSSCGDIIWTIETTKVSICCTKVQDETDTLCASPFFARRVT